ncbi:DUF4189 domain-containing protein [Xanthomonas hyacinthi]|uniref:DUF4189 domain-containing protein n=1 Tax=Xanthomonas hyacinthi TaxID=56455 RepID=A0A2S7EYX6_9XANT|nr:DUF4189 domain-containing protein [Xanthomonas hyacinthi]PPU98348.1 hypothetical protein XhyaCFBP1156_06345 [Xanthomonas hyacinthi]QGY78971.1 DUF4189 domain-containing protein [Xanthomonas hyacinthi]
MQIKVIVASPKMNEKGEYMKLDRALIVLIACIAGSAQAEQGCPPGQIPAQSTGSMASCGPIPPGYYTQQEPVAPRPSGEWKKTWGAIAIGSIDSITSYGVITGKHSKTEAEEDALKRCASHGETNCKIGLAYRNQCAVIAEPQIDGKPFANGFSDFVGAGTTSEASTVALERCKADNKSTAGAACKIIYQTCSEPIFQKY